GREGAAVPALQELTGGRPTATYQARRTVMTWRAGSVSDRRRFLRSLTLPARQIRSGCHGRPAQADQVTSLAAGAGRADRPEQEPEVVEVSCREASRLLGEAVQPLQPCLPHPHRRSLDAAGDEVQ